MSYVSWSTRLFTQWDLPLHSRPFVLVDWDTARSIATTQVRKHATIQNRSAVGHSPRFASDTYLRCAEHYTESSYLSLSSLLQPRFCCSISDTGPVVQKVTAGATRTKFNEGQHCWVDSGERRNQQRGYGYNWPQQHGRLRWSRSCLKGRLLIKSFNRRGDLRSAPQTAWIDQGEQRASSQQIKAINLGANSQLSSKDNYKAWTRFQFVKKATR